MSLSIFFQWPQRWWRFSAPGPLLHKHNYQGTQERVQENQIGQKLQSWKGKSSQHTQLSSLQLTSHLGKLLGGIPMPDLHNHFQGFCSPLCVLLSYSGACSWLRTYRQSTYQLESQLSRVRSKRSWMWMKAKWWMLTLPTDRNQQQKLTGNPCITVLSEQCWLPLGKKAKAKSTSVLPSQG